jgi:uncharacterized protein
MGSGHSSAPFSDAHEFCATPNGVAGSAEKSRLSRAVVSLLLLAIRFYQVTLASLMPSACKFYPTCSHYATEAIARHGVRRGLRLAALRLWRCRPLTQGGYDPVPDAEGSHTPEVSS